MLKEAKVIIKGDIADVVERTYFDKKIFSKKVTLNKTKYAFVQNELNKLSE